MISLPSLVKMKKKNGHIKICKQLSVARVVVDLNAHSSSEITEI